MSQEETPNNGQEETPDWQEKIQAEKEALAETAKQQTPEVTVEEVPPSPAKPTDSGLDPDKCSDASRTMSMCNRTSEEIAPQVEKALDPEKVDAEKRRMIIQDREHLITRLLGTDRTPATTSQAQYATEAMRETKDPSKLVAVDIDKTSRGDTSYPQEVSGTAASVAFTARIRGIKKVYLYNSGFYVCLRPMDLSELDEFYMEVDHDGNELGRIVGGLMFLVHDTFLKDKFMDVLQTAVIDSNLKGWDRKTVLRDNISAQDLDTLYWAICSMMHKNGIKLDLICGHEECGHISKDQLMGIDRMRIVDTSVIPEEALRFLLADEQVTHKDLTRYRDEILAMKSSFTHKNVQFDLRVPTMGEVLTYSKELMSVIVSKTNEDYSLANAKVIRSVMINYNRNFTPWISRVTYLREDGTPDVTARDTAGIHAVLSLNDDSEDEGVILDKIGKFTRTTKLSHIGYAVLKCAKCGESSSDAVNGFKAWDAQSLFTSLTSLKLEQIGMA